MSFRKYIRKNVYRLHRNISLGIAIPILMWTLSGFLHPVMSSFKPQVRNQQLPSFIIDTTKIIVPLSDALARNGIEQINNFRLVSMDSSWFYQVRIPRIDTLIYLSCVDGKLLENGDSRYAAFLAQLYLSAPLTHSKKETGHHAMTADMGTAALAFATKDFRPSVVRSVKLVKGFNNEYKSSNVFLPVYRVAFEREDHIRLYIETGSGRLAAAVDDRKAWFTKFFSMTHTWSFLDGMGITKNLVIGTVSFFCLLSASLGFYVYNISGTRKRRSISRRGSAFWHRTLGNTFMVTTMLFAFSGTWHSFHKLTGDENKKPKEVRNIFDRSEVKFSLKELMQSMDSSQLVSVSIVKINGANYWQVDLRDKKQKRKIYLDTKHLTALKDGDRMYAGFLSSVFSSERPGHILRSSTLTAFNNRYSMMNKRLPVEEVTFDDGKNYYIETSTGTLASVTTPGDQAERFTFSNLHMHHYWESWLGTKTGTPFKNTVLIASTLGLLIVGLTGTLLYIRKKTKKRPALQTRSL